MQPPHITIVEVGPRDGLQMEKQFVPTETKVALVEQIALSGIRKIEATSFVRPDVIPQMKDASEVLRLVERVPGTSYMALVANVKGAQRAIDAKANVVKTVICATESSNRKNTQMTVAESLRQSEEILKMAKNAETDAEAVISVAFGCPYEGDVADDAIVRLTAALAGIGFCEIAIADTVGLANPAAVRRMSTLLQRQFANIHFSLHFHNTRGLGLANVLAGIDVGIDQFDASIGGLGGCPIVKGGIGNVTTEDLVNMLDEMGISCGVSLDAILEAARMAQRVLNRTLSSYLLVAGSREQLYRSNSPNETLHSSRRT